MSLSAALPKISTNVRFAASALLFPELAGAWAERLFLTPPRAQMTESALDLLDARSGWVVHKERRIATWEWGWKSREAPAILLAHGWGGHAAQLRAFVFPLLSAGYRVIAFDQPAHGISEGGLTGLPDFADVLAEVVGSRGGPRALIAHSLGAAAAAFAMTRGVEFERVVLISPPSDVIGYSRRFARWHWIPEPVRHSMQAAIEERYGVRWEDLDAERIAPRLSADALIIHDRDDRIVPLGHGMRVARAWPGARLVETRGLGHGRILRDPNIVQAAADFVTVRSAVAA